MNSIPYSVLLVEDDPSVLEMARVAAAESSFELELTVLEGVEAALDWIRGAAAATKQMPGVVFIDLKLPKLEGLGVLRTMRNCPAMRDVPIVVYSSEHAQPDVLLSYYVGANSFVAKPADHAQFHELFRDQLAYWMRPREGDTPADSKVDAEERIDR